MLKRFFINMTRFSTANPWKVIIFGAVLTAIAGFITRNLRVEMTWVDMVPGKNPSVAEFNNIATNFGSTANIILTIEHNDEEKMKEIAREITLRLRTHTNHFRRVDYSYNADFFKKHALMMQKTKDLKQSVKMMKNLDLYPYLKAVNDNFEKTYIGGEEELEGNEREIINGINGVVDTVKGIARGVEMGSANPGKAGVKTADKFLDDSLYSYSLDKKMLFVTIQPTCTINEIDKIGIIVPALRGRPVNQKDLKEGKYTFSDIIKGKRVPGILDEYKIKYPDTRFRLTGFHIIGQDEMEAGTQDSMILTIVAFIIILAAFIIVFRMFTAPVLAMLILIVGIVWDLAITTLVIGRLSMMTAFTAAILMGIGIDYFIHILSSFTEGRLAGKDTAQSSIYAMEKSSTGVMMGGLTTALAFFALTFSGMEMLWELGVVLGCGILTTMTVSFLLLPAALQIIVRKPLKRGSKVTNVLSTSRFFERGGEIISRNPWKVLMAGILAVGIFVYFIKDNTFDQNILNIEMKGLESVELQREMVKRYGMSDGALVFTTDSVEESQKYHHIFDSDPTAGFIDSIAMFIPSVKKQQERLPYLKKLNGDLRRYKPSRQIDKVKLTGELKRFEMNLLELEEMAVFGGQNLLEDRIGQILKKNNDTNLVWQLIGDIRNSPENRLADFQIGFGTKMKKLLLGMSTPQVVTEDDLPEDILSRYIDESGEKYLFSIYSKSDIWHNPTDSRFIKNVIAENNRATGSPVFMKVLIEDVAREGKLAMIISFLCIVILLIIDLRNIKAVLLAISPLVLGSLLLFGITGLISFPYTVVSVMLLPLIIGIGIDDGIHLIHRFKIEGDKIPLILNTTGKALFLTSFTTMVAFGSLMFAKFQGFVGMGLVLFIGIGTCFLVTILFIPAALKIIIRKNKDALKPWGRS